MSTVAVEWSRSRAAPISGAVLAAGMLMLAAGAALLAGWVPIAFSIATVFLFAGPHNWFEARYFLGRLPARAGKLWNFFAFAFAGIVGLTMAFALIPWIANSSGGTADRYLTTVGVWNSLLILWVATLVELRRRQNPRRDWGLTWPIAFGLIAANWMGPYLFSIAIVYLHPLIALWILDRELRRSYPRWRPAYHACLAAIPLFLGLLWWRLHDSPSLPGDDVLSLAITRHAGADILSGVSSHFLVAAHTFLEMVHYGVWVVVIPLIGMRSLPWQLHTIPAARRSSAWRRGVTILLLFGLLIALVLWVCFVLDYPTTRQIYFTVALLHVLAEVPFLLRAL